MGVLGRLLFAPLRAPVTAPLWIAAKLAEAAEDELSDPATIKRALSELEAALDAGTIDEAAYELEEAVLLRRLTGRQGQ